MRLKSEASIDPSINIRYRQEKVSARGIMNISLMITSLRLKMMEGYLSDGL